MGARITGMDEWLRDLEALPKRVPKEVRRVAVDAGRRMEKDWRARWEAIRSPRTHIPHLLRGIGSDVTGKGASWSVEVGVDPDNRQAFLSKIIEYGTLTSGPHPAGIPTLNAEAPKTANALGDVGEELLER